MLDDIFMAANLCGIDGRCGTDHFFTGFVINAERGLVNNLSRGTKICVNAMDLRTTKSIYFTIIVLFVVTG